MKTDLRLLKRIRIWSTFVSFMKMDPEWAKHHSEKRFIASSWSLISNNYLNRTLSIRVCFWEPGVKSPWLNFEPSPSNVNKSKLTSVLCRQSSSPPAPPLTSLERNRPRMRTTNTRHRCAKAGRPWSPPTQLYAPVDRQSERNRDNTKQVHKQTYSILNAVENMVSGVSR